MIKNKHKMWFYVFLLLFLKPEFAVSQIMCDNFEYPAGALLTNYGWTAFNSFGVNPIKTESGSLSYNGYPAETGNSVLLSNAGGEDVGANFILCNSGSVYCAFLVKVKSASANGEFFFHFGTSSSGTDVRGRVFVKSSNSGISFGISKSNRPALYSNNIYFIDSTYLIVLKYTFVNGNSTDDIVSLFINPQINNNIEPLPDLTTGIGENDATNNISNIALRQGDALDSPLLILDGLRIGLSWQETPLPVNLNYFYSIVNGTQVNLIWETSFEINNKGFEIERKNVLKEDSWKIISFTPGNGTSWNNNLYTYTDVINRSGSFNYRLKQVDYNGTFAYYELNDVVDIFPPLSFVLNQNFPNPSNPSSKISFRVPLSSNISLKIYDVMGKELADLLNSDFEPGDYSTLFDGNKYSSGVYFYKLSAVKDGKLLFTETKKMVLIK